MQGTQSSIVPEKTEKRGLMSGTSGPLEAAKRYLDRQRENDAALAAMEEEGTDDGRPAWLRRWQGGAAPSAGGTNSGRMSEALTAQSPHVDTRDGERSVVENGYTGQSIEAAFAFETIFQYETELEAEETEDWLELSGERPRAEGSGQTQQPLLHLARESEETGTKATGVGQPSIFREIAREMEGHEVASRPTERPSAPVSGPDPQAVRAAIFRLAQEATQGWTPAQHPAETSVTNGTSNAESLDRRKGDVAATGEDAASNSATDFAEIARQLWTMPEATLDLVESQAAESTNGCSKIHPPAETLSEVEDKILMSSVRDGREIKGLSVADALPFSFGPAAKADAGQASETAQPTAGSEQAADCVDTKLEPEWTLSGELTELRSEIRSDLRDDSQSERRSRATEADPARIVYLPESSPATATFHLRETQKTASDAPALAHDAGNLFSALKLYSELLALSGVLQARHSHYAQDLKLLAARSEVLIDRLLAACGVAEREVRQLVRDHGLDATGCAPLDPAPPLHAERTEPPLPNSSSLPSLVLATSLNVLATGPNQSDHFAAEDVLAAASGGAEALSSGSAVLRSLEEPSTGQHEAPPHQGSVEGCESSISTLENAAPVNAASEDAAPQDDRFRSVVAPSQDTSVNARWAEAESSQTRSRDLNGDGHPGSDPINLVDLLTRWGSLLSMIARGPVEVKFGPQAALPILVGEEAMERILVNLVHNAMTATRNGGAIRIGVGRAETRRPAHSLQSSEGRVRPASKMVLTVDDSGCGMTEQQIAKALGLAYAKIDSGGLNLGFDRAGATEAGPQSGGHVRRHGMGLQIVRELVAASGGELAIYSRCGVGTRIEIRWPTLQRGVEQETISVRALQTSAGVEDANPGPVLTEQRRPPQSAKDGDGASGGFTHNRIRQGFEGAIAC